MLPEAIAHSRNQDHEYTLYSLQIFCFRYTA